MVTAIPRISEKKIQTYYFTKAHILSEKVTLSAKKNEVFPQVLKDSLNYKFQ